MENRFAEELKKGSEKNPEIDIPYSMTRLDDIDGWDLRHTRKVEWYKGPEVKCNSLSIQACTETHNLKTKNAAKKFLEKAHKISKPLTLPEPAEVLTNEDLISELVDEGLSSARSEELSNRLNTLQRLADWYYQESGRISEHEIRAYLVWPLLQVLGWSEQCVKFEWKNLDLALLEKTYTEDNQNQIPIVIGETKRLFSGLSLARKQAEDSLKKIFGRTGK